MFPERTPGSILPNDYAYNNGNDPSYREQYPWFLEKIARAQFRFIGLDAGEKHKGRSASPEDFAYWWVNIKQIFEPEISGNYLWSPTRRSDGGHNEFYENMKNWRCPKIKSFTAR